jgi:hypothetical protein
MIREPGAGTQLTFANLSQGNYEHLNALAKRWRAGKIQQRTQTSGMKTVEMQLKDAAGQAISVSFPDVPGEDFDRMWEERELDVAMVETLAAPAIVLVVNGDTIKLPAWIVDRNSIAKGAGLAAEPEDPVDWSPTLAPTQIRLVELLQMLMSGELDVGPRRLAILVSAWDKVEGEELEPEELVAMKLPLLDQYLRNQRDPWTWRIWGISAQGGKYEDPEKDEHFAETEALRDLDRPSDRIKVVSGTTTATDITLPLEWLIS